jgi:hypothetical protein
MSSPSTLHFPDAVTMTQYLSNHALLKTDYFEEIRNYKRYCRACCSKIR